MPKKKAFTLVELLVVISIIALLVSILMPSLNKARELAYRAKCGANLSAIGKSQTLYSKTYNSFPILGTERQEGGAIMYYKGDWGHPGSTAVYTGLNRELRPSLKAGEIRPYCITSLFYILVREDNPTKIFVCPSDTEAKALVPGDTKYKDLVTGEMVFAWDFLNDRNVSYSLQSCRNGVKYPGQLVIAADKTPVYDLGTSAYTVGWSPTITKQQMAANMSQNHGRGEAMNVLYADSRVGTNQTRADINDMTSPKDCIFTWYSTEANAQSSINTDPQGQGPVDNWLEGIVTDSMLHGPYKKS